MEGVIEGLLSLVGLVVDELAADVVLLGDSRDGCGAGEGVEGEALSLRGVQFRVHLQAAEPDAVRVLREDWGIHLHHVPRGLEHLTGEFDRVLAVDGSVLAELSKRRPDLRAGLLGSWVPGGNVADPFQQGPEAYRQRALQLAEMTRRVAERLARGE